MACLLVMCCGSFSVGLYGQVSGGEPAGSALPTGVHEQLQRNATAMRSIHLEYTVATAGPAVVDDPGPARFSSHFEGHRFYQLIRRPLKAKRRMQVHENAFDGRIFYFGNLDVDSLDHPAELTKYLAEDATDPDYQVSLFQFPYLDAAGFYVPDDIAGLNSFSSIESLVLHHVNESDSTQVEKLGENLFVALRVKDPEVLRAQAIDLEERRKLLEAGPNSPNSISREIERLRRLQSAPPSRKVTFVLDPKRGYAVIEREEFNSAGSRTMRVQSYRWKYYEPGGVWLPERCGVFSYFDDPSSGGSSNERYLQFTSEIRRIDFGIQTNLQFALHYKQPGTKVRDRTTPEARANRYHQVSYTVAANGNLLRGSVRVAPQNNIWSLRYVFIGANVVILSAVITILSVKHRRRLRKAQLVN